MEARAATVRANVVTALSGFCREPWPAVPRAVRVIQAVPRSPVAMGYRWLPSGRCVSVPPDSPMAVVTPSKSPGWASTR